MASHSNIIATQDELRFVHPTPQEFDRVLQFTVDQVRHHEPICHSVGLTEEEGKCEPFIPTMVKKSLAYPTSLIVLNAEDEIVAVNLTFISEREKANSIDHTEGNPKLFGGAAKVCNLLDHIETNYWDLVPKHWKKLAKLEILVVRNDQTRKGIANKLTNGYYLENLKNLGCDGIVVLATAFNSQSLFIKNGYKKLKEVKHEDWCDENGKRIFVCSDKTDRAILLYKELD